MARIKAVDEDAADWWMDSAFGTQAVDRERVTGGGRKARKGGSGGYIPTL